MPQSRSPLFDDLARLASDAAGVAQGVRREVETIVQTQMERFLARMDVVSREEFEAVKEMAALARDENEALARRIHALEERLAQTGPRAGADAGSQPPQTSGDGPADRR